MKITLSWVILSWMTMAYVWGEPMYPPGFGRCHNITTTTPQTTNCTVDCQKCTSLGYCVVNKEVCKEPYQQVANIPCQSENDCPPCIQCGADKICGGKPVPGTACIG